MAWDGAAVSMVPLSIVVVCRGRSERWPAGSVRGALGFASGASGARTAWRRVVRTRIAKRSAHYIWCVAPVQSTTGSVCTKPTTFSGSAISSPEKHRCASVHVGREPGDRSARLHWRCGWAGKKRGVCSQLSSQRRRRFWRGEVEHQTARWVIRRRLALSCRVRENAQRTSPGCAEARSSRSRALDRACGLVRCAHGPRCVR